MENQTLVEAVNQIIQRRLAHSNSNRKVHLHSRADTGIEIEVDGKVYSDLSEIDDDVIRDLIQSSIQEWEISRELSEAHTWRQGIEPEELSEPLSIRRTVQVIGLDARFAAYFIDAIFLSVISILFRFLEINTFLPDFLISVVYFVGFWATKGQTPGKMALGIKVVSRDGSSVSWGQASLRYIGYIISAIPLMLGFIWIAFDSKGQGWHDKIAGTYVVPKNIRFSSVDTVTFGRFTQLTTRQHISALILAGSPIISGILLFVMNPAYIGRMIFSCQSRGVSDNICSQPCGWIMLGMSILFVSIAYFGIRGSVVRLRDNWGLTVLLFILFFVSPALFLVLLGPAVLVIMETPGFG